MKYHYIGVLFFIRNLYEYYIKDNPQDIQILINSISLFSVSKGFYDFSPDLFKTSLNAFEHGGYISKSLT